MSRRISALAVRSHGWINALKKKNRINSLSFGLLFRNNSRNAQTTNNKGSGTVYDAIQL